MKKKILIIGASGRIGFALTKKLILSTHEVVAVDKNTQKLKILNNNNLKYFKLDILNLKTFEKFLNNKDLKNLDTVIYTAYPFSNSWKKNNKKLSLKDINYNLSVQLGLPIKLSDLIINFFLKNKIKGQLIHVSSILGVATPKFEHYVGTKVQNKVEYSIIKSGIILLTKYLAKKYKKKNIRVNCVSPGGIYDNHEIKFVKNYLKSCGSKGLLDAQDLIGTFEFLISSESKFINGQNIIVDDGWSL